MNIKMFYDLYDNQDRRHRYDRHRESRRNWSNYVKKEIIETREDSRSFRHTTLISRRKNNVEKIQREFFFFQKSITINTDSHFGIFVRLNKIATTMSIMSFAKINDMTTKEIEIDRSSFMKKTDKQQINVVIITRQVSNRRTHHDIIVANHWVNKRWSFSGLMVSRKLWRVIVIFREIEIDFVIVIVMTIVIVVVRIRVLARVLARSIKKKNATNLENCYHCWRNRSNAKS